MPTNYLRRGGKAPPLPHSAAKPRGPEPASLLAADLTAGRVRLDVSLADTPSAHRILAALPLYSIVETWGDSLHFQIPITGGRDRTAKLNADIGELYYWAEEERLILVYGPTPISGNGVIRLPRPCNVVGHVAGDFDALRKVHPGQKVVMKASS